jgi:hypothetical protein
MHPLPEPAPRTSPRARATPPAGRPLRRRWGRRVVIAMVLVVATAGVVLTRPSVLAAIILPAASRAIGGDATADRIALGAWNELVVEGFAVEVPGWPGAAGEIARSDRMRIRFDPFALLLGDVVVESVAVDELRLRLAERSDSLGNFSFQSLEPAAPRDGARDDRQRPARISVEDLVIEAGLADAEGGFERLGDLRFRGALSPEGEGEGSFRFLLEGRPDADGRLAVGSVSGSIDADRRAVEVDLRDLAVARGALPVAPSAVRLWAQRLDLEGRVVRARFAVAAGGEPDAEIDIEGVALDLPAELLGDASVRDLWSGFRDGASIDLEATPRLSVAKGTLRVGAESVALEGVEGLLGASDAGGDAGVLPVPFTCEFRLALGGVAEGAFSWEGREAWLESAASLAPFRLSLGVPRFSSPKDADAARTLLVPRGVARILSDFAVTEWTLEAETRLERGLPDGRTPAPVRSSGSLRIAEGSAAFEEFPYRLDGVHGVISFEGDDIVVERVAGRCADGAVVEIDGTLEGVASGAEIDLRIACADAPIDERLFAAFEPEPRRALEMLFDAGAADALGAAGLLPDAAALVAQRQDLARLGDAADLRAARERLERSIGAGPFALGGRCGFEMRVYSPAGFGQPVLVTGRVDVRDAGLVLGRFPYPLRIREGTFTVLDEAIEIGGGGLRAVTPAGGVFTASGSVRIPRDGRGGRDGIVAIEVSDTDDVVNPALIAAIPDAGDEVVAGWPGAARSPAGDFLHALGLTGDVELNGLVATSPDGGEDFRFRLAFANGRASPDEEGRRFLAGEGLPWPADFVLEDCAARIDIVPERATIERCTGRRGAGGVVASGWADLEGPGRLVELELSGLPVDRSFEPFLSRDPVEAAARFALYRPSGTIDGAIRREVDAARAITRGRLVPRELEITLDGSRVRAERLAGRIAVDGDRLRAESLEYRLASDGAPDGILRISGPLGDDDATREAPFEARLAGGRFDSPLLREVLRARASALGDVLRGLRAGGTFGATYAKGDDERLEFRPERLEVGAPDARIALAFREGSAVTTDGGPVRFGAEADASGAASGVIRVRGEVLVAEGGTRASAEAHYRMDAFPDALRPLLPPPLDTAAEAIALGSEGAFSLDLPLLEARWDDGAPADRPALYRLEGDAAFTGGRFDTGPSFDRLDGGFRFALRSEPAAEIPVSFEGRLDARALRAMEFELGHSAAIVKASPDGASLRIDAEGDVATGRFELDAAIALGDDAAGGSYDARLRIADADYGLLRDPASAPSGSRASAILAIGGPTGGTPSDVAARRGAGRLAIRNATLADLPLALRALQLTQLMLPVSGRLSDATAAFSVEGDTVRIERCRFAAGTLELEGDGTVDIPTYGLALRLYPKGTVPLVSDLIGGVMNQIFAIDIGGDLRDPKASLAPLPTVIPPKPPPSPASEQAPRNGAT